MSKSILIKPGTVFKEINEHTIEFFLALMFCCNKFGRSYTITSANDGQHCKESYHYKNMAWDIRLKNLSTVQWYELQREMVLQLPSYFDVVVENINDPDRVHLHVECDLKKLADYILGNANG